ncbi:Neuralized-like protein 4, partial [Homalodisca vitripennis]
IYSWSGSLEIGVTSCSPTTVNFPPSATDLRNNTWVLSGNAILKDGVSTVDTYGVDLDKAIEGDLVGVMRTSQ